MTMAVGGKTPDSLTKATLQQERSSTLPRKGRRYTKPLLFLLSVALSMVTLLGFDYVYSAAVQRQFQSTVKLNSCGMRDPVRAYTFKTNCTCLMNWGRDPYQFYTNSLGFRDERIRDVPLSDAKPRLLILGDSFTLSMTPWQDSYVGQVAAHLPQYDFLNGGVMGYSVSNYPNVARMVFAKGVDIDEVIVFLGVHAVHDEAAVFHDISDSGAVALPKTWGSFSNLPWSTRKRLASRFLLTYSLLESGERFLIRHGYYHVAVTHPEIAVFDLEASAWTYRQVDEADLYPIGYAPLGVKGGIAKAKAKMDILWQELQRRNIPISVVVYPDPAQLIHDSSDSIQVRMWREWCQGKCKRFISVFPDFFALKNQCPRLQPGCWYLNDFVYGDIHYSAKGNAIVADAMIKGLADDPPVKLQPQLSGQAEQP